MLQQQIVMTNAIIQQIDRLLAGCLATGLIGADLLPAAEHVDRTLQYMGRHRHLRRQPMQRHLAKGTRKHSSLWMGP
jgi:hypothetical protein